MGELSSEYSNSEKLFIDGLFLSKAYNVSARKLQRNYVSRHWRVMRNLKENWFVTWKMTRILLNFQASSRKSGNLHFDWILLFKTYKDLDEKVKKGYVSYHQRVCKVSRKNDSWFQKWHEEFGKFQCVKRQVWKILLVCATFLNSI